MAPKNGTHYHAFDPPPSNPTVGFDKSRTRQSEAKDADINNIVARYDRTGVLPTIGREGFYADVSQVGDYRDALERVRVADEAFMQLPAKVRAKFDNDAAQFLDWTSDPGNREEMRELGLIEADPADEPPAVVTPAAVVEP